MVACTEGNTEDGGDKPNPPQPQPEKSEISLDATSANFTTEGGEKKILFSTNEAWTAEIVNDRADGWLSISPTSGAAGNATLTVAAEPNDTPDERTASVRIKAGTASKTISVSQKQKDALTVTSSKFEVGAEGGEVKIEVKANIDFEYTIDSKAQEWISHEGTRAMKTSTLTFYVAENDDTEKREGKIAIKSGEFNEEVTIYQAGAEPSIVISQNEYVVAADGETISVEVSSNVDVAVEMPADADWISESTTRATSTNTYCFDIQPNLEYEQRTAEIKFTNKENGLSEVVAIKQMQRDAIVLADSEYEFGIDGGNLDFEVQTNVDITVTISEDAIDWIQQVETRGLDGKKLYFNIKGAGEENRVGAIIISGGNATQTIKVKQIGRNDILEKERKALIALYEALDGDNWTNNENWCSDKPVMYWYGITTKSNWYGDNPTGIVKYIHLQNNNLKGSISEVIGDLEYIEELWLFNNDINGEIPKNIGALKNLINLDLSSNELTGQIPSEIGNLERLKYLDLSWNKLTGSIPESLGNLKQLRSIIINANGLSGKMPELIMNASYWPEYWLWIINQSAEKGGGISRENLKIPAPKFSATDIYGNTIDDSVYKNNKYTAIFNFEDWCQFSQAFMPTFVKLYNQYKEKGFEVIALSEGTKEELLAENQLFGATWPCFDIGINNENDLYNIFFSYHSSTPCINIVNSEGYLEFICEYDSYKDIDNFLLTKLGPPNDVDYDDLLYKSTDYSADGKVKTLQRAAKGEGIDIVLMGDAYSDRLIADGTYDKVMNTAMEKFFTEEPYKSYRDHFNVYSVTAVSDNEVYTDESSTTFAGYFGGETLVGGNDQRVFSYAEKAIGAERMNDALIVVMMNSEAYAGTCYMYSPSDNDNWGDGVSISYFPVGVDDNALAQVLHHEAGGHGFSKLADEYAYVEMGAIPDSEISSRKSYETYGWYKNVDFTNDPTKVKWSTFLSDARYANDGLGVYEGAFTYWTGAYRPTINSIMNTNTGGFNAPSREAIYYRIHKLAYGSEWEYDYEKFVEYDAINRKTAATTRGVPYRLDIPEDFKPLHPPVVMNTSWRNAKNNAPAKNATRSMGGNAGHNLQKSAGTTTHTTAKPMTASTSITLPDGTVRTTTISSSGATKVEYKKTNK